MEMIWTPEMITRCFNDFENARRLSFDLEPGTMRMPDNETPFFALHTADNKHFVIWPVDLKDGVYITPEGKAVINRNEYFFIKVI